MITITMIILIKKMNIGNNNNNPFNNSNDFISTGMTNQSLSSAEPRSPLLANSNVVMPAIWRGGGAVQKIEDVT